MLPTVTGGMPTPKGGEIKYLDEARLNALTRAFETWFDSSSGKIRKRRARHWTVFLTARYTGARIGEILAIDDEADIDWRRAEFKIRTLKRRTDARRVVPVPERLVAEIGRILAEFPDLRGNLFRVGDRMFRYVFRDRCREAGIPDDLAHPHVLRHTRALELLRAGIPVSAVQEILGHAYLTTTAVYLRFSAVEVRRMMEDRGLL